MINREQNFRDYVKSSIILNAIADIGKYSSLLYGIANAIDDNPNIDKIIGAGVIYLACSALGHASKGVLIDASNEAIEGRFDDLEEKLK